MPSRLTDGHVLCLFWSVDFFSNIATLESSLQDEYDRLLQFLLAAVRVWCVAGLLAATQFLSALEYL